MEELTKEEKKSELSSPSKSNKVPEDPRSAEAKVTPEEAKAAIKVSTDGLQGKKNAPAAEAK